MTLKIIIFIVRLLFSYSKIYLHEILHNQLSYHFYAYNIF